MAQAGSLFYRLIPELDHAALAKAASASGTAAGGPMGKAMGQTASEHMAQGLQANGAKMGAAAGAPMGQAMGKVASDHMAAGLQASGTSMEAKAAALGTRVGSAIGRPLGAALSPIGTAIGWAEKQFDRLPPVVQRTLGGIPGHAATAGRGLTSAIGSSLTESTRQFHSWGQGLQNTVGAPIRAMDQMLSNFGVTGGMAVGLLGAAAVTTGVKFEAFREQAEIALTTMLQSSDRAHKMLADLQKFALETPFELPGLMASARQLIAFGFDAKDVIPTLSSVGDAVAGLGGNTVTLQRVTYALGQIQTRGKVMATEMLQLTNAGIPAWAILANSMGTTTGELQKMVEKGMVPAKEAIPLLLKGMSEGTDGMAGKTVAFKGMMEAQATTLVGVWARMKESFQIAMGDLVKPAMPALKEGMRGIIAILSEIPNFLKKIKEEGQPLVDFVTGPLAQSARNVWDAFYPVLSPIVTLVGEGLKNAWESVGGVLKTVGDVLLSVTQWMKDHEGVMTVATYAVLGYVGAVTALSIINSIVGLTYALATGIRAIGLAIMANPIGLIVGLLAALAAGLIYAYNHSEEFRRIVDNAWAWVKNAAVVAWEAIKVVFAAFGAAIDWVIGLWQGFTTGASTAWTAVQTAAATVWEWLRLNVFEPLGAALDAVGRAWTAFAQFATDAWNVTVEIGKWALAILMAAVLIPIQIAINAVGAVFTELKNIAVDVWTVIKEEGLIWWEFLKANVFDPIVNFVNGTLIPLWESLKVWTVQRWTEIKDGVAAAWTAIYDTVFQPIVDFVNNTLIPLWDSLKVWTVQRWTEIKDGIALAWRAIYDTVFQPIVDFVNNTLIPLWESLKVWTVQRWTEMKDGIALAWRAIYDTVFQPIVDFVNNTLIPLWESLKTWTLQRWTEIKDGVARIWQTIKDEVFQPIVDFVNNTLIPIWTRFKDAVVQRWNEFKDGVAEVWDWVKTNVFDPMVKFVTEDIPEGFRKGVEWIGELWTGIKKALREPLQMAIDVVWNNGIVKVWNEVAELVGIDSRLSPKILDTYASGGVWKGGPLPGNTPGRDVHRFYSPTGGGLALSGGESIMRPEFTEALGRHRINELNRAAKLRGTRGLRDALGVGDQPRPAAYADGAAGLRFAQGEAGKPYVWGGVGPKGYDCSGFIAAIANVIEGRAAHKRLFATSSFGAGRGAGGFVPGENSAFTIGVTRDAGGGIGHMAGTLLGQNVESRGGRGVLVGPEARGARDSLFPWRYFLPGVGGTPGSFTGRNVVPPQGPPPVVAPPPPVRRDYKAEASAKWQTVRDQEAALPAPGNKWTEIAGGFMRRIASELWTLVARKADEKNASAAGAFGEVIAPGGEALAEEVRKAQERNRQTQERAALEAQWRAWAQAEAPNDPAAQEQAYAFYKRKWEKEQAVWDNLRRYTGDTAIQQKMFDHIKWAKGSGFWQERGIAYPVPEQNLAGEPAKVKLQMGDLRRHFGPALVMYSGNVGRPPDQSGNGDRSHFEGVAIDTEPRDDVFNYISDNWPETGPPTRGRTYSLLRTQAGKRQINWGLRQAPSTPWVMESHTDHVHWTRDWDQFPPGHGTVDPERIRDEGGWLPPGWSTVYNGTGRDELVLNAEQLAAIAQGRQGGGALVGSLTVQVPERASARDVVDELTFALRHSRRGGLHGRRR